jgi:hypothetical protein
LAAIRRGAHILALPTDKTSVNLFARRRIRDRVASDEGQQPYNQRGALMLVRILTIPLLLVASTANAHDVWSNGKAVPAWIKAACCGPQDVHHLRPDQVHRISDDFYAVDGYSTLIPARIALPSQDGDYWIFYDDNQNGRQSMVFCFFVPMNF